MIKLFVNASVFLHDVTESQSKILKMSFETNQQNRFSNDWRKLYFIVKFNLKTNN